MHRIPRLLVASVGTGDGKTAAAVAIAAALRARGLGVATFKLGPDEHDGALLAAAAGRASHVLDPWLMGRHALRRTLVAGACGADIALVEGARGLFDGLDPRCDEGSTAELARWLELPTVLVVDGAALGSTVAAVARGLQRFDPRVQLDGLVANRVSGAGHALLLSEALRTSATLELRGWLPVRPSPFVPPRTAGASGPADRAWLDEPRRRELVAMAEDSLDLDALLQAARSATPLPSESWPADSPRRARIALALDDAFERYFEDDLARIEAAGAELVPFSPLEDEGLPDVDGLLLGDGPVSSFSLELARNRPARAAVRAAVRAGLPTLAFGGGALYLTQGLRSMAGTLHPFAGVVDVVAEPHASREAQGYVEVVTTLDTVAGPAGTRMRGFGRDAWRPSAAEGPGREPLRVLQGDVRGAFAGRNFLALPFQSHWASSPAVPEAFIDACVRVAALT